MVSALVEMLDDGGQVIGVVVHVVALAGLGGPAVAAPIGCDDPVPLVQRRGYPGCPEIGSRTPAIGSVAQRRAKSATASQPDSPHV